MKPRSEFRRTKIVCTIGPSVAMPAQMRELIYAGMDVARLNFSHGDRDTHRETIRTLRRAAVETGKEIGILQDLGGPKIRLGKLCGERRNCARANVSSWFRARPPNRTPYP